MKVTVLKIFVEIAFFPLLIKSRQKLNLNIIWIWFRILNFSCYDGSKNIITRSLVNNFYVKLGIDCLCKWLCQRSVNETLCAIWCHLYNLKNVKRYPWRSVTSSKVKVTLVHGCFSPFLKCSNGTKSRKTSKILRIFQIKGINYRRSLTPHV